MLTLDKKRLRVKHCPCGKSNKDGKFVPFIGYDDKGYCHACGETFRPQATSYLPNGGALRSKFTSSRIQKETTSTPQTPPTPSYIPGAVFLNSLKDYSHNNFVQYLTHLFGNTIVQELLTMYNMGTSAHWAGANIFWQADIQGTIRAGKIMLYNPLTGKRVKQPHNHFNWVHTVLKLKDFKLQQCLFGEHLLNIFPTKPVALVESEKTAIISSVYMPQFVWLATGGIANFNEDRCHVLAGHDVILYPDLSKEGSAYNIWQRKAIEVFKISAVSNLLENNATETDRQQGLDLADYLLRFNHTDFVKERPIDSVEPIVFTWEQLLK